MVIPEEREGRDEYNPLLNRDPTPANEQAYGTGAAATIDRNDTRRGGILPMTMIVTTRPKVECSHEKKTICFDNYIYQKSKFHFRLSWICENFVVNYLH